MTTRLPTPGSDDGTWGDILNSFLDVSHNSDGSLKSSALVASGAVTSVNSKAPVNGVLTIGAGDIGAIASNTVGQANGIASLDGTGNVPVTQLGNLPPGSVPAATAAGQTIVSNASNAWKTTTASTIDTTNTPQADTGSGNPGTNASASSSNHSHPLSFLGRNAFFGMPAQWAYDYTFDGTTGVTFPGVGFGPLRLAFTKSPTGGVYSLSQGAWGNGSGAPAGLMARNITIDSGATLQGPSGAGLIIIGGDTITINGTIDVSGNAASGSTGGSGGQNWSYINGGGSGANGATGAGTGGTAGPSSTAVFGGGGGSGGASGATVGGTTNVNPGNTPWNINDLIFLNGSGGSGGASGAGDGTNAGGGGGAGGNILLIVAPKIVIGSTASLLAKGGDGAPGTAGNAGGGGGGGGGVIALHALEITIASGATLNSAGGNGGAGVGTGSPGAAGAASGSFIDPPTANGGFGYGNGYLICQWQ